MKPFRKHLAVTFSVGAAALSLAAPPSVAKPPPGAMIPQRIDPQAKQVFYEMAAAYRALHSYSGTLDVGDQRRGQMPRPFVHSQIAFQRPNQAVVVTTVGSDPATEAVADGAHTLCTSYRGGETRYFERPTSPGIDLINTLLQGVGSCLPVPVEFMDGANLFPYLNPKAIVSLSLGREGVVDGVPVEAVVVRYRGIGVTVPTETFLVGKADHLLRRLVNVRSTGGQSVTETATFRGVTVNASIPASRFAVAPPPGAIAVSSRDALYAGPHSNTGLKVGDAAPTIQTQGLDGKPLSLADYRGRVVLLDFWATWCSPCRAELPSVVRLYRAYHLQGLEMVSVAEDRPRDETRVRAVTQKTGMVWPQVRESDDELGAVALAYGVGPIPHTVLIGRDGKVAAINPHGKALEAAVRAALAAGG